MIKLHGLLVVDKPLGVSSMDVVRKVRWAASKQAGRGKQKVGHAGTLDPLATGVVVCLLGKATQSCEQIMTMGKVYQTTVDLCAFTETDDREGERREVRVHQPPDVDSVRQAVASLTGEIEQTPPAFSAIHINGQRSYKLARRGDEVTLAPRPVRIDRITLDQYDWPMLKLTIACGRGTYIRALARDLGVALNTGGHLAELRRTAVGPYDLSKAVDWQRLDAAPIHQADLLDAPDQSPD